MADSRIRSENEDDQSIPECVPCRDHLPLSIVWCPIPVLTWLIPIVGHLGIANTEGIIHDFVGPYMINKNPKYLGFGAPTKYYQIKLSDIRPTNGHSKLHDWDEAVDQASCQYENEMHNLCCNNCHDHVSVALNRLNFKNQHNWGTVSLIIFMCLHSHYVSTGRLLKTWIPFIILCCIALGVALAIKFAAK